MKRKYNFTFDEWCILNGLLNRPDKERLLESLDASLEKAWAAEDEIWGCELPDTLTELINKVEAMSEETLRDIFSMLPVDASLGISLYR